MAENKEQREIDLLELVNRLWEKRKFIIKISLMGLIIGIIIAFSIPKEYKTTVVLKTDSAQPASVNMSTLASMAGINLNGNTGEDILSPDLYPDILKSTPFIQGLFDIRVYDNNQAIDTTLFEYFHRKQKSAWWNYIIKAPEALISLFYSKKENQKVDSLLRNRHFISKREMDMINTISKTFSINSDKKTGVTTLEVTTQSPTISAFLADTLTSYLQSYIIEQRTKKAKTDLRNSEKLYEQTKIDYYKVQQELAAFTDANLNVISAKYLINQEKLKNEANTAYTVFNQMAQQVQMNKIKIQNDTPVFTIIQPAVEPLFPSRPKKKIIVITFVFLFFAGGCSWIVGKDYVKDFFNNNI